MQISEFVEVTTRLETYYNKEYTNEQRKIMFEELGNFELDRYKFLVSKAIRTCKYLPKISELLQINANNPSKRTEETEKIDCQKCKGTGYILYKKNKKISNKTIEYEYAAICNCGNAKQYRGEQYYIPTIKEIGIG